MGITPWGSIVYCGMMLIRHHVHLIKMNLWDHGVGMKVDAFRRDKGEGGRRLFGGASYLNGRGYVGNHGDWITINGN